MSTEALRAEGLVRAYEGRRVVDVERISVDEGDVVAILGPNGAGKSTLFRLLALLEEPDSGTVSHFGRAVSARDTRARRRLAAVFQRPYLFQGKVRSNVAYGLRLRRTPRRVTSGRVDEVLGLTGISHLADADVRTLSGGEAQRVALARALIVRPSILFLDEPSSNLDIDVRRRFRNDLRSIVQTLGTTVVLITHDRTEAFSLAQKVMVMRDGRIVQQGPVDEVYSRPVDGFVAGFMGSRTIWRGRVDRCAGGLCTVRVADDLRVEVIADRSKDEAVSLVVRPEDVVLDLGSEGGGLPSSARNRWAGTVTGVHTAGPVADVWVALTGGSGVGDLHALVTRPSVEGLGLAPGVRVTASVKATAVHLLDESVEG